MSDTDTATAPIDTSTSLPAATNTSPAASVTPSNTAVPSNTTSPPPTGVQQVLGGNRDAGNKGDVDWLNLLSKPVGTQGTNWLDMFSKPGNTQGKTCPAPAPQGAPQPDSPQPGAPSATEVKPLSRGMGMGPGNHDDNVRAMQQSIQRAGLGRLLGRYGADGKFGPLTENAVRTFQHKSGLNATGIADADTMAKLNPNQGLQNRPTQPTQAAPGQATKPVEPARPGTEPAKPGTEPPNPTGPTIQRPANPRAPGIRPGTVPEPQTDIPVPNGRAGIERTFGAPGTNLTRVMMPAGPGGKEIPVTVNKKIADKMLGAFREIKSSGLSDQLHTFDGTYNYRAKAGGNGMSVHSWGIAVDLNAGENPFGRSSQNQGQQAIAAIFRKWGFRQLPNDPMHFQYATGY